MKVGWKMGGKIKSLVFLQGETKFSESLIVKYEKIISFFLNTILLYF